MLLVVFLCLLVVKHLLGYPQPFVDKASHDLDITKTIAEGNTFNNLRSQKQ